MYITHEPYTCMHKYICLLCFADETRLDERYPIKSQLNIPFAGGVPSVYLRRKGKERGELFVYIDSLL